jgi:hypothetical protein
MIRRSKGMMSRRDSNARMQAVAKAIRELSIFTGIN